jgi:hypothetical protein
MWFECDPVRKYSKYLILNNIYYWHGITFSSPLALGIFLHAVAAIPERAFSRS